MYYSLTTDGDENTYMKKERGLNSHINLGMGRMWGVDEDRVTLPYRYTMSVVEGQEPRLDGWYPGSHLMQQRLVELLQSSGADNIQTFPAEIREEEGGALVLGYVVANIIGRVPCANMEQSEHEPLADVQYFHKLIINQSSTRGLLMFRVDESPLVVLVHERIARVIEAGGFEGLVLEPITEARTE